MNPPIRRSDILICWCELILFCFVYFSALAHYTSCYAVRAMVVQCSYSHTRQSSIQYATIKRSNGIIRSDDVLRAHIGYVGSSPTITEQNMHCHRTKPNINLVLLAAHYYYRYLFFVSLSSSLPFQLHCFGLVRKPPTSFVIFLVDVFCFG